jgi:hypothetical protein
MYVVKPDEELLKEEEARKEGANAFKAAPDMTLSGGSAGAAPKAEGSSGAFTNLRGFIDANKDKNKDFAQGIASNLKGEQDKAIGAVQTEADNWTTAQKGFATSDPDNLVVRAEKGAGSLSSGERDILKDILKGGYGGQTGFTSDGHQAVVDVANKTKDSVSNQGQVLNDWYSQNKIGNVSQGEKTFDRMMLSRSGEAQAELKKVADTAGGLEGQYSDIVAKADKAAGDVATKNTKFAGDVRTGLQGAFASLLGDIEKARSVADTEDADKRKKLLGPYSNLQGDNFADPLQANTFQNVMTNEQQANILALADLLNDPKYAAAGYGGPLLGRNDIHLHQDEIDKAAIAKAGQGGSISESSGPPPPSPPPPPRTGAESALGVDPHAPEGDPTTAGSGSNIAVENANGERGNGIATKMGNTSGTNTILEALDPAFAKKVKEKEGYYDEKIGAGIQKLAKGTENAVSDPKVQAGLALDAAGIGGGGLLTAGTLGAGKEIAKQVPMDTVKKKAEEAATKAKADKAALDKKAKEVAAAAKKKAEDDAAKAAEEVRKAVAKVAAAISAQRKMSGFPGAKKAKDAVTLARAAAEDAKRIAEEAAQRAVEAANAVGIPTSTEEVKNRLKIKRSW